MPEPGIIDRAALITHHWLWQAVDLLFPPVCINCGKEGVRWCQECLALVKRVGEKICIKCGKHLAKGTICKNCTDQQPRYQELRSYGLYRDPLRRAILSIKYRRDLGLGEILAGFLERLVIEHDWNADLIIPVPISPHKHKERGYNQVDVFGRPLAWRLGLPYQEHVLQRVHEDSSQVKLSAAGRRLNVANAFAVSWAEPIKDRRVILVDDVATTGSTAEACAGALMDAGAGQVYVATLTRSLMRKNDQEFV